MTDTLWIALALVLIVEGIGPLLFPNRWQNFMHQLASQAPQQLRTMGGTMVTIGLVALYFLLS
ncbi:DUF2065 family protein [Bowmanella sp. Y26]|uniref:DUF2065 domain-containing protein n=1 Tax=Bowmanella yangjiangensis TaxID=2811230 RepID=A0ABS3CRG3_9ALTE|nr:DUF2065 domain-containing protein [Bowmanella yangjiangensis]MBN7819240.1 DUF2065 domain-containing protein [Bowmanella yangjiangensis]MBT1065925.1 DUF2065 family protein [Bowmanella yangjiangensis]